MSIVSDYRVIREENFNLTTDGDIDVTFTQQLGTPTGDVPALLSWVEARTGGSGSLSYQVIVNGTSISTFGVESADSHSVHKAIRASLLREGENQVTFKLISAQGSVQFRDVVLHFRKTA